MSARQETRIAFIGFGEAGRAFARSLAAAGPVRIAAYDILQDSGGDGVLRAAAAALSVDLAVDPAAAAERANVVISAVTAAESLKAAQSVRDALRPGQVFIDINSVSPGRKQKTAALVEAAGAAYCDMAVMAPVHPRGHRTPVLVAGAGNAELETLLNDFGFDFDRAGERPGDATAIKMIRSLFVKGLEALTVQALAAAAEQGVYDRLFASLAGSFPGLDWSGFPAYQFERMAIHGQRRAAEMRESAATFAELGFARGGDLARAVAALQDIVGAAQLDLRGAEPDAAAAHLARALKEAQL